jgi:hypothetical protein
LFEKGGAYTAAHGFGHEEWLFNFAWRDADGYKYAFLQPINKNLAKYQGKECNITLYTKSPSDWFFVGVIKHCVVLTDQERLFAYELHREQGWLEEMRGHLRRIHCDPAIFQRDREGIFNIKFKKEDVHFFDPYGPVPNNHKVLRFHRYQVLLGDLSQKTVTNLSERRRRRAATKPKKTGRRSRRHTAAVEYDPLHDKIQNALYKHLVQKYGSDSVKYEEDGVDLKLRKQGKLTFFEVKGDHKPKQCIRKALGQLLEYAYWPPPEPVDYLVVVGESMPDRTTCRYLKELKQKWNLPIYYASFSLGEQRLSEYF